MDIPFNPFTQIAEQLSRIENQNNRIEALLNDKAKQAVSQAPPTSDKPLNIGQAAELLGMTKGSVYGMVHKKTIPHSKKGKRLYFNKDELLTWVQSGRRQTITEIEQEARQARFSNKKTETHNF